MKTFLEGISGAIPKKHVEKRSENGPRKAMSSRRSLKLEMGRKRKNPDAEGAS